jgi:hypothetical protein
MRLWRSRHNIQVAFLLPLFFSGLREASPPAQYALAFNRFYINILSWIAVKIICIKIMHLRRIVGKI